MSSAAAGAFPAVGDGQPSLLSESVSMAARRAATAASSGDGFGGAGAGASSSQSSIVWISPDVAATGAVDDDASREGAPQSSPLSESGAAKMGFRTVALPAVAFARPDACTALRCGAGLVPGREQQQYGP